MQLFNGFNYRYVWKNKRVKTSHIIIQSSVLSRIIWTLKMNIMISNVYNVHCASHILSIGSSGAPFFPTRYYYVMTGKYRVLISTNVIIVCRILYYDNIVNINVKFIPVFMCFGTRATVNDNSEICSKNINISLCTTNNSRSYSMCMGLFTQIRCYTIVAEFSELQKMRRIIIKS